METNVKKLKNLLISQNNESFQTGEFWQAVLDVGYEEWQKPKHEDWNYGQMVAWMGETYGPVAKFLILAGKYNEQVENGGHRQYFDNRYADGGDGRKPDPEIPLHEEMVTLFEELSLHLHENTVGAEVLSIVKDFKIELNEDETISCDDCGGSGEQENDCQECNGESEDCATCGDTGVVDEDCGNCDGSGYIHNDNYGEILNSNHLDALDSRYYTVSAKWISFLNQYTKDWIFNEKDPELLPVSPNQNKELKKPKVKLVGADSNAGNIISICRDALKKAGYPQEKLQEFIDEAKSGDYNNVLVTAIKWCDVR